MNDVHGAIVDCQKQFENGCDQMKQFVEGLQSSNFDFLSQRADEMQTHFEAAQELLQKRLKNIQSTMKDSQRKLGELENSSGKAKVDLANKKSDVVSKKNEVDKQQNRIARSKQELK